MVLLQIILVLLLCSVALGWVARHYRFPYPIALVIVGGVLGFIPNLPQLPLDPQFILVLVLPPVLYQAALLTSWRDFKANFRPIGLLAFGLVVATTLAVGTAFKVLVADVPWAVAFVLGAIVSPPDALAATTVLSRLSVPRRVTTILEGESLVNDASGLEIYKFAVAAVLTGAFSLVEAGIEFVEVAAGGIAVGGVLGMLYVAIRSRIGDTVIEVLTTLAVPYVAYVFSESLHLSGVLAVVAAGIVQGRHAPQVVSPETRISERSAWNLVVYLLNSLVFMLMGLQLSGIVGRLTGRSATELILAGLLISAVAILVRFAWIFPALWLPRFLGGAVERAIPPPLKAELFIMSWCGMRGIVSLAAALALPLLLPNGQPFPQRDLIVFITFVVIVVTLVGQGLSLPRLIRNLPVARDRSLYEEHRNAGQALGAVAVAAVTRHAAEESAPPELVAHICAEFSEKYEPATAPPPEGDSLAVLSGRLRRTAIRAQRQELIRLWQDNQISDDVLHHIEEDLDYHESHL